MVNSTFQNNIVDSDPNAKYLPSSPCLLSLSFKSMYKYNKYMNISSFLIKLFRIFIEECEFIENQSDFDSNCITFEGFNLTMTSKYRENSQFISFYHLDVRMINNSI